MRLSLPSLALVLLPFFSCNQASIKGPGAGGSESLAADIKALGGMRIFFAHQSVGYNILDGLSSLGRESAPSGLRIVEGRDAALLGPPALLHAAIGVNGDPEGKIREFVDLVEGGIGNRADVAILKFCYADLSAATDVKALFSAYGAALSGLEARYPQTLFPMLTVPLTTVDGGLKALAKRLLGRGSASFEDNQARSLFNELVRAERGRAVFDLAAIESTSPDGSPRRAVRGGVSTPALCPEYSLDGGHLNSVGSQLVASRLAAFLASKGP